ncbi:MAG: chemotaxis response regulator protein-glutamate methylesterase [Gammaproteobacteria bacterium]|nr:chemotaxis response regulator protein-glutamate methylesterase [Gammaproteobacteria bacterium]MDH5652926.1 chemotaxis response regulator protein-glutamate methylesterase [Gammaproteobacteria bacterium]
MSKIGVLVIDDSALIRRVLTEILNKDPHIEVLDTAADPLIAREKIKKLNPDVLTLDVEMPKMDGITFLRNLMRLRPMPVVMVSTMTEQGADVTLEALELGAVDYVTKPNLNVVESMEDYAAEIIEKVKMASKAHVRAITDRPRMDKVEPKLSADAIIEKTIGGKHLKTTEKIIAIGASTGGTEAIRAVLEQLPANSPGVVVTQHIPAAFSKSFAKRVDSVSALKVVEASDGDQIIPGHAFIAPGDRHLIVERSGARYYCRLNDGPPVNRHIPSVDVLFRSVAQNVGPNAIGVILTGMGDDGARGMLEMKEQGAVTIAQDEKSSVVWGMPGEAVKIGAADTQLPLGKIAGKLLTLSKNV